MPTKRVIAGLTAWLAFSAVAAAATLPMSVTSSSFTDGGKIPGALVGTDAGCGTGKSFTPQVAWSDLPQGTRSLAVTLIDPDGGKGQGVIHWVAYNIAPSVGQLSEGGYASTTAGVTVGRNSVGQASYRGLCPPAGDPAHHYVMTIIATDLAPGALPANLDRTQLLQAINGHGLSATSIVGTYGH